MEVELKYTVPDHETFEQLLSLTHLGDYWLRPAGDKAVIDHYYDTAERAAFQGGYSLRLREPANGGPWLATLKSLGTPAEGEAHEREEFEARVPAGAAPQDWPAGPARDQALALVGAAPVHELFVIRQQRHKRMLHSGQDAAPGQGDEQAQPAAELSLDEVSLPLGGPALSYELEIELLPGGERGDLSALAEALRGYALASQRQSKFERALAQVDGHPVAPAAPAPESTPAPEPATEAAPAAKTAAKAARAKTPGVRAEQSMAEAGRRVMRFHFERMLDQEAGVRAGADIEAVHDMRVATRRQRAALGLFADHYKRKPVKRFTRALQQLTHRLGAVRDLDVQLKAAHDYTDRLAAPAGAGLERVLAAWGAEREAARTALLAHLDSRDYRDFKKAYKKFLNEKPKPPAGKPTPRLVRQLLPGQLWDHYSEVRAYETVIERADVPTLHALRIDSKSLRYALEFFREVLEPVVGAGKNNGIGYNIEAMVALQDHIGELHDADVTLQKLHAFLQAEADGQPGPSPETVLAVGHYLKHKQTELDRLRRTAGKPWAVVIGAKFRKLLGQASAGV